jgi:hypothetical protein
MVERSDQGKEWKRREDLILPGELRTGLCVK